MEWSRVKTSLIAFLLIVNIILAYGIASRVRERNRADEQGVRAAVLVIGNYGIEADAQDFLALPRRVYARQYSRDTAEEESIARALLGRDMSADGVGAYKSGKGQVSFLSDGFFKLLLTGAQKDEGETDERFFTRLLRGAGIDLSCAEISEGQEGVVFSLKTAGGHDILHSELLARFDGAGNAVVSGQWLFTASSRRGEGSRSRSELTFTLGTTLRERGASRIDGVELVYSLAWTAGGNLQLAPVWQVSYPGGELRLNAITGALMN